ncbi:MAG TPA: hypothetical protein VLZ75_14235 [Chitinophagales bacterium]|nr:hypothetical protein [Chitinophagales bacterium]
MQKETYFYPSFIKNVEELIWLNKTDTEFLWIYQENEAQREEAEDMMIEKLIKNPRVLNSNLDKVSILKYTGQERFHFLIKNFPIKKVVVLGIEPKNIGIQLQLKPYEIVQHLNYYFLKIDAPEKLANLPKELKIALAQKLAQLSEI